MGRVVVTGAGGLLGWHACVRLHARNCAARYRGEAAPHDLVALDHAGFADDTRLAAALAGADAVLHFAGVNRASDGAPDVEAANPAIARRLAAALSAAGGAPALVYANSTHAAGDTPYGRGKRAAGEILGAWATKSGAPYTDLTLPHIFGEGGRPFYNNVTGTLCAQAIAGAVPEINPEGRVELLHAGAAAAIALDAALSRASGPVRAEGRPTPVPELWERIRAMHGAYAAGLYPDLSDPFDRDLFNTYRLHGYPEGWPRPLRLNTDPRGTLFEAAKGGGGGQVFFSRTHPGVTRGNHFHLHKVERFLVVEGEAVIRIRPALRGPVWEYPVSGAAPAAVDMPTLHTHAIENVGAGPLLTLFWTHEVFDPAAPDTYADPVLPC